MLVKYVNFVFGEGGSRVLNLPFLLCIADVGVKDRIPYPAGYLASAILPLESRRNRT